MSDCVSSAKLKKAASSPSKGKPPHAVNGHVTSAAPVTVLPDQTSLPSSSTPKSTLELEVKNQVSAAATLIEGKVALFDRIKNRAFLIE